VRYRDVEVAVPTGLYAEERIDAPASVDANLEAMAGEQPQQIDDVFRRHFRRPLRALLVHGSMTVYVFAASPWSS
jgi:hypothetical protein